MIGMVIYSATFSDVSSANEASSQEELMSQRMSLYMQFQNHIVPWYYLAAIDQYERNIQAVRPDIPKRESTAAIQFSKESWAGALNPQQGDTSPFTIKYFGGIGMDGNGDGIADPADDEDVMLTMSNYLSQFGATEEDFKLSLYEYYQNELAVNQIVSIAKLYKHYDKIELDTHVFPVPVRGYNYSYRGTWGANRGWGGRRIHEGTDIFAGYSTPVVSTSYGIIEIMGWNEFGGWRVGVRDNHNTYHYYAHLAYFNKDLKVGDIVEPGTLLGGVGSSGYGKEGTSGKFPPHLHYGMYKFNGRTEWAFDPYPSLRNWEKYTRQQKK
ncbi:peptidase M23 [Lysinibacillus yapensis]|uniref:Peptidase M23 n=2 Tax=Ureibacillus yapensis TaxID=2304605 RepID=A0A396S6X0_9BACL|nr:peptidase M23 [Lysinibacillus yapensis]